MNSQYDVNEMEPSPPRRNFFSALLFPANLTGLGHIGIYTVCFLLLTWVRSAMISYAGIAVGFIGLIATIELINYLYHCVRESANGAVSAPDSMFSDSFDTGGVSATLGGYFILQIEYLSTIFPVLICFVPALLYSIFIERFDHIFVILMAGGVFYFPMLFLAVVLFNSSSGYNPFIHIVSILKTFFFYCLLVFQTLLIVAGFIYLVYLFGHSAVGAVLLFPIQLYCLMVLMHLLGRFYFLYQKKLNWDV